MRTQLIKLFVVPILMFAFVSAALSVEDIEHRRERARNEALAGIKLADQAMKDKNYDRAIELYTAAIDAKAVEGKDLGKLYFIRGIAYQGKKDCTNAVADYDKATEVLTDNADLYFNRAICEIELKQDAKSLADLDAAIKLSPDSVPFHTARCTVLFNKQDLAGALPDCEAALRGSPDDKNLLLAVSQAAERLGDKAKAAAAYRHLLQVDPGNAVATAGLKRVGG